MLLLVVVILCPQEQHMTQNTCVHEVPTVTPQDCMKLNSVAPVLLATSAGQWVSLPLLISATQAISVKRYANIPPFAIKSFDMHSLILCVENDRLRQ